MEIEDVKKQNTIILLAGILLIVLAIFLINLQSKKLTEAKASIAKTEQEIVLLEEKLNRLLYIKAEMPNLQEQFETLLKMLPKQLSEQDILKIVQTAVIGTNGNLPEIRFYDPEKLDNYNRFSFQLVFDGSYQSLLQFIANLEAQPNLIAFKDISIRQAGGNENLLNASLNLAAFYAD